MAADPKKLDETIPGGIYRGADGVWHDAHGKPLPEDVAKELDEKFSKQDKAKKQSNKEQPAKEPAKE